ncbi:hypothetical protein [sulfur-oxidizing endosymbiont of Gigantopelta aegis]|uniref:hypothetical protein n=1 Tax=sulfur-oxidizing endosymbiont of Gigantopelta aegis TaxID=2794934 RepID=UPI0018DECC9C|nr:hypothetical protein [sulfur-oxidizing endosymbiont of Gigantopelta aegis]
MNQSLTKSSNKLSTLIITAFILLFMAACSQLSELDSSSPVFRFQKTEDLYRASMRWGEWPNLFQIMRDNPKNKSTGQTSEQVPLKKEDWNRPTEERMIHLSTIKISSVSALSSGMSEEKGEGTTRLLIEYHFDSSVTVLSLRHTLHWWYDKENNAWYTDTPLPKEFDAPKHKTIKLSPKHY